MSHFTFICWHCFQFVKNYKLSSKSYWLCLPFLSSPLFSFSLGVPLVDLLEIYESMRGIWKWFGITSFAGNDLESPHLQQSYFIFTQILYNCYLNTFPLLGLYIPATSLGAFRWASQNHSLSVLQYYSWTDSRDGYFSLCCASLMMSWQCSQMEPGWVKREDKATQRNLVMLLLHRFSNLYAVLYPSMGWDQWVV
jgi:hypothetical protein